MSEIPSNTTSLVTNYGSCAAIGVYVDDTLPATATIVPDPNGYSSVEPVVEVDGYAFHANNPKQLERDKMKDTILQKYGIPILRIKTNEGGEETKLRDKLIKIFKT